MLRNITKGDGPDHSFLDKCPEIKKMDVRFWIWNVRTLYRISSLRTVAEETSKYKLDFVGLLEVKWAGGVTEPGGEYTFFC